MSMFIPRVIYTLWVTPDGTDADPPPKYCAYDESWRRHCPNYTHTLLRTSDIAYMWANEPALAEFRAVYKKMRLIERCDYSRYALMALKGSVYRDLNVMCYQNIDPLLEGREMALVREPVEFQNETGVVKVGNQFLASVAGAPFWLALMRDIRANYRPNETQWDMVLENTGPTVLGYNATRHLPPSAFIDTCAILPYMHPAFLNLNIRSRQCRNTPKDQMYAAKEWQASACWGQTSCKTRFVPWKLMASVLLLFIVLGAAAYASTSGSSS